MAATLAFMADHVFFIPNRTLRQGHPMRYSSIDHFLKTGADVLQKGPVALILVEDLVEVDTTIRHHHLAGFATVLVFAPTELQLAEDIAEIIHRIDFDMSQDDATQIAVNSIIPAANGSWLYYCYNGEYLFYPFCETRTVSEMLAFHSEERRDAMLSYVVDIYADDLNEYPLAVSLENAYLDGSGYYALARSDGDNGPKERQLDFYGGLRWRFEEHIPELRRRIDRISIFRAKPGLNLQTDHTFNDQEYNTYACPWHHNLTVAIASFRTAKALKSNSGSTFDIHTFKWVNSTRFEWQSQQLLDLGLMEPGQWF